MGMVRKTVSVGTLGVINFRSKNEKLVRAEKALEKAEKALDKAKTERQLARLRRRSRRVRKAERLSGLLSAATPAVEERIANATDTMRDLAHKGRQRGRRARKAARKAAHEMRVGAEHAVDEARSVLQD
jgi:hypothetical protein